MWSSVDDLENVFLNCCYSFNIYPLYCGFFRAFAGWLNGLNNFESRVVMTTYNSMFYSLLNETCCFWTCFQYDKNTNQEKKKNEEKVKGWKNFITLWVCGLKQNVSLNDKRCLFLSIKPDSIWLPVIVSVFLLVDCLTVDWRMELSITVEVSL